MQFQTNGQLNLFCSSYKNTHFHQISSLQVKKCVQNCKNKISEKFWPKKVLKNIFAARGHIFQPILKIPFCGRRYGIDEQHTKNSAPQLSQGPKYLRVVQCTPPCATHNNLGVDTERVKCGQWCSCLAHKPLQQLRVTTNLQITIQQTMS